MVRRHGWRIVVCTVVVVITLNGLAPWGSVTALQVDAAMQLAAAFTAVICGVVVGFRARGSQRAWRLLIAAGLGGWGANVAIDAWSRFVGDPSSSVVDLGFLILPVCGLAALGVLASARPESERAEWRARSTPRAMASIVLDGLVASGSFFIFVWVAALGPLVATDARPDTWTHAIAVAHPISDFVMVIVAVTFVMLGRVDQHYVVNLLFLAAGLVAMGCSGPLRAWVFGTGADGAVPWAGIGFILGPLLIAAAVLGPRLDTRGMAERGRRAMDWWQLVVPYVGVLGASVFIGAQMLLGRHPGPVESLVGMALVVILVVRQLVSLVDNRLLIRRVYAAQSRLTHQAYHDALTGLPNRIMFAERLDDAVRDGHPFGLIFVDIDDFKDVNDRFGHAAGDQLLCHVGDRLRGCLDPGSTLARIGGDEFAILLQGDMEAPEVVADQIRIALRQPFVVHSSAVRVKASMGLVMRDPDEPDLTSDELLGRADTSMYAGKRLGKDTAVVYRPSSRGGPVDFPTALRRANNGAPDGFGLVYQSVVRLSDSAPVAVEALSRWTAPNGTQISPETFVAAAEAAGLGATFDAMVLDQVCADLVASGLDLPVHVNMGAARLGSPEFEKTLFEVVSRHGLSPNRFVVEITETVPILDLADGAAAIRRLRALGFTVALDDFGSGFNSLTYLHALPVDMIKLDRTMTLGVEPNDDAALYRSVIGLCKALNLEVIAEGVETVGQADTIRAAGCHLAQGYLYGRPVPLAELMAASLPG